MAQDKQDEDIELGVLAGSGNGDLQQSSCSFCGKSAAEVDCLLAGSGALICNACVARYKAELKAGI